MDESACQPGWAWGTSAASLLTSESSDRPNISGFMVSLCFNRCREHHLKAEHSQRFVHAKQRLAGRTDSVLLAHCQGCSEHCRVSMKISPALDMFETSFRGSKGISEFMEGDARVHMVNCMVVHVPGQPLVCRVRKHNTSSVPCISVVVGGCVLGNEVTPQGWLPHEEWEQPNIDQPPARG